MSEAAPPLPHRAILVLAVTQIIGWGTTYYVPSVIAARLREALALSQEMIFGGLTIMLLVSAAVAPSAGRIMERRGAPEAMILGSLLMALSLLILSQAQGLLSYACAWVVMGVATPIGLNQAASTALAQIAGEGARRAISRLLLITGFSATIFWPVTAWLDAQIGWRATLLIYAGINLLLCAPLHALIAWDRRPRSGSAKKAAAPSPAAMPLRPEAETAALVLAALAFSLAGIVSWGMGPLVVELLKAFGHPDAIAVTVGALGGPAAVAARLCEVTIGQRAGILTVALVALAALPAAVALPLFDDRSVLVASAFVVGYGMSAGAMTIVRSVLPLSVFGRDRYARLLGRLAVPQNIAFAFAPMIFAGVMGSFGPRAAIVFALASAILALAAMVALALLVRRSVMDRRR